MITPGVLFLNKTYGRKNNKHLYKFKPDKSPSVHYIPYTLRGVGFSKVFYDIYVLAEITEEKSKIKNVIGPTNELEAYYKYQLHCHNLILPQMTYTLSTDNLETINSITEDNPSTILRWSDRTSYKVFSIDGENTTDYDDAFSIQYPIISVYISDVYHVLDELNLWTLFTGYVSNIYMPYERIMLLCKDIAEICSLKAGKESLALTMDFNLETEEYDFLISKIKPYKNFIYNEQDLLIDEEYGQIYAYIEPKLLLEQPKSEDIVEYLMRLMCFKAGETLYNNKTGIFRTINKPMEDILPSNKYITFAELTTLKSETKASEPHSDACSQHCDAYAHITSPIRRLVDILNQIELCRCVGIDQIKLSNIDISNQNASLFYKEWELKLDYVNQMSKSIRRVQNESMLLHIYESIKNDTHEGRVLPSETYEEGGIYHYTIFLESLHLIAKFQFPDIISGTKLFKVYKFDKESSFRKKIRLGLVQPADGLNIE